MAEGWVVNASLLILLAKVGLVEMLAQLTRELVVPAGVRDEIVSTTLDDPARKWLDGAGGSFVREARRQVEEEG
ncbi:MAG: hypothetical protein HZA90_28455 [Verrucomicrobia bacterium]|nr:hypothetical protein [Verrucomicrobiota bacterium]